MSGALGPMSGAQGPPGVAASGAIPNGFVHMSTPRVINGTEGDATSCDSGGHDDNVTPPVSLRSGVLEAGTYATKVQARKVSGNGNATVTHVDITAMALAVE